MVVVDKSDGSFKEVHRAGIIYVLDMYVLSGMPSLYALDGVYRVLVKYATPERVVPFICGKD